MEIADTIGTMRDGCYAGGDHITYYTLPDLVKLIVGESLCDKQRLPLPDSTALYYLN